MRQDTRECVTQHAGELITAPSLLATCDICLCSTGHPCTPRRQLDLREHELNALTDEWYQIRVQSRGGHVPVGTRDRAPRRLPAQSSRTELFRGTASVPRFGLEVAYTFGC